MKYILVICTYFLTVVAGAQNSVPTVPQEMMFADLNLNLSPYVRERVQEKVNSLYYSKDHFDLLKNRVLTFVPHITKVFQEESVPDDFKYLAIQESSLISDAISKSQAVGFWQFKDFTAKEQGLRVDKQVDERKNIIAASKGAAIYLKNNNYFFRNWLYTLLSYNLGLSGANKLFDRSLQGSKNVTLGDDTHIYVIHFLAHKVAWQGVLDDHADQNTYLVAYTEGEGKSLDQLANQYGIDQAQVRKENLWLSSGAVPNDKVYYVYFPVSKEKVLTYQVQPGFQVPYELSAPVVAQTNETPLNIIPEVVESEYPKLVYKELKMVGEEEIQMVEANGIPAFIASKDQNLLVVTEALKISRKKFFKINDLTMFDELHEGNVYYLKKKKNKSDAEFHVALYGESLWDISQMYGMKLKCVRYKNRMSKAESLQPGRLLFLKKRRKKSIPIEIKDVPPPQEEIVKKDTVKELEPVVTGDREMSVSLLIQKIEDPIFYEVKEGETMASIAKNYKVTVSEILEWNELPADQTTVQKGQMLIISGVNINKKEVEEVSSDRNIEDEDEFLQVGGGVDNSSSETDVISFGDATGVGVGLGGSLVTGGDDIVAVEGVRTHTVARGEFLYKIARMYEIDPKDLAKWNGLDNNTPLKEGQELYLSDPGFEIAVQKEETPVNNNESSSFEVTSGNEETTSSVFDNADLGIGGLGDIFGMENTEVKDESSESTDLPNPDSEYHIVKRGENLNKVAGIYNVDAQRLREWNGLPEGIPVMEGQQLRIVSPTGWSTDAVSIIDEQLGGFDTPATDIKAEENTDKTDVEVIVIPTGKSEEEDAGVAEEVVDNSATVIEENSTVDTNVLPETKQTEAEISIDGVLYHTVSKGETLFAVSRNYNASIHDLKKWNNRPNGAINVGEKLIIGYTNEAKTSGGKETTVVTSNNTAEYHTVAKGESVYGIARMYKIKPTELQAWNNIEGGNIHPGQKLVVKKGSGNTNNVVVKNESSAPEYHTVDSGETLYSISRKYGVSVDQIRKLNNKSDNNLVKGQQLRVK